MANCNKNAQWVGCKSLTCLISVLSTVSNIEDSLFGSKGACLCTLMIRFNFFSH